MAEEVKVRVVQENSGTALKDAKRDIDALNGAGKGQGTGDPVREAVRKAAGHGHGAQGFSIAGTQREVTTLIREMATGMPSGRTVGALLGQLGVGRLLLNPFVIGLTTAIGAAAEYVSQQDKTRAMQQDLGEKRAAGVRLLDRMDRFSDNTAPYVGEEKELREKIAAASVHRQSLLNEANSGLGGRFAAAVGSEYYTKGWGGYKPQSALNLQAHDAETAQMQAQLAETEKRRQEKAKQSLDLEHDSIRANVNRNRKEMHRVDDLGQWWKDYRAELNKGTPEGEAQEIASDKTAITQRDRAGLFSRLINAKSGAADVAAAAALSREQRTGSAALGGIGRDQMDHLLAKHMAPLAHMSREQFQPRLKLGAS